MHTHACKHCWEHWSDISGDYLQRKKQQCLSAQCRWTQKGQTGYDIKWNSYEEWLPGTWAPSEQMSSPQCVLSLSSMLLISTIQFRLGLRVTLGSSQSYCDYAGTLGFCSGAYWQHVLGFREWQSILVGAPVTATPSNHLCYLKPAPHSALMPGRLYLK